MLFRLVITCEHGGNDIPPPYAHLFSGQEEWLSSHRGLDIGALQLYSSLIKRGLADFSTYTTVSRLLVELNRSPHHPSLFSKATKPLDKASKKAILDQYYFPYRSSVEKEISNMIGKGEQVLHISVHSFTPELNGEVRNTDIGILYDPANLSEKLIASRWKSIINETNSTVKVRYNYPYLGKADGFPTYLRKQFKKGSYAGIELEVNQKFHRFNPKGYNNLIKEMGDSIEELKKQLNQIGV